MLNEVMTPAAERLARELGIHKSVTLAQQIIEETLRAQLTAKFRRILENVTFQLGETLPCAVEERDTLP